VNIYKFTYKVELL